MASPPGAGFGYDEASVWGFTVANPKGRLTHTSNGVAGTVYSYDPMGRSADQWQCTPLNCGTSTFHLHYTYDLLGDLAATLNYAESSKTYTYIYDTAARLTSMVSSTTTQITPAPCSRSIDTTPLVRSSRRLSATASSAPCNMTSADA